MQFSDNRAKKENPWSGLLLFTSVYLYIVCPCVVSYDVSSFFGNASTHVCLSPAFECEAAVLRSELCHSLLGSGSVGWAGWEALSTKQSPEAPSALKEHCELCTPGRLWSLLGNTWKPPGQPAPQGDPVELVCACRRS